MPVGLQVPLVEQYTKPPRHYHTIDHASRVAGHVRSLGGTRACLLAAWFHDVVYVPTATNNEEQSAQLVENWLEHDPDVEEAARLVRLTADHRTHADDRDGAVICDSDLAVLGSGPKSYEEYRAAVREEYAHVDDAGWREGRTTVLRDLLGRGRLFRTHQARERWEAQARENLAAELRELSA